MQRYPKHFIAVKETLVCSTVRNVRPSNGTKRVHMSGLNDDIPVKTLMMQFTFSGSIQSFRTKNNDNKYREQAVVAII